MELKSYAELVIILVGLLIFLGAILDWKWLTDKKYLSKSKGLQHFIYEFWGQKAYRFFIGFLGLILTITGFIFLYFKK